MGWRRASTKGKKKKVMLRRGEEKKGIKLTGSGRLPSPKGIGNAGESLPRVNEAEQEEAATSHP